MENFIFYAVYLSSRNQRTKINAEYSSWEKVLFGVPQGSILVPLLSNISISDLFFIIDNIDFAIYADNNMPYGVRSNIEDVIVKLQNALKALFKCFTDNQMKANQGKCNFIFINNEKVSLIVENEQINIDTCEKLLDYVIDGNLCFNGPIADICNKAGTKLNALSRITSFLNFNKKNILINAFFLSQFNYYCQLMWICHDCTKNNKINKLLESCLWSLYNDKKDGSVSIHHRHLRALVI